MPWFIVVISWPFVNGNHVLNPFKQPLAILLFGFGQPLDKIGNTIGQLLHIDICTKDAKRKRIICLSIMSTSSNRSIAHHFFIYWRLSSISYL